MNKRIFAAVLCTVLAAALLSSCRRVAEEPSETEANTNNNYYSESGDFVSPVYASLSEDEKAVYDKIKTAVSGFRDAVAFDPPISRDTAAKIYRLIFPGTQPFLAQQSFLHSGK